MPFDNSSKMNVADPVCAQCGHPKSCHFNGRGCCREWAGHDACLCSQFIRLRWDKRQPAKVGTQPAIVRFRVHNNPTRWAVWLNRRVEFQTVDDGVLHHGIVDRIVSGIPFICL